MNHCKKRIQSIFDPRGGRGSLFLVLPVLIFLLALGGGACGRSRGSELPGETTETFWESTSEEATEAVTVQPETVPASTAAEPLATAGTDTITVYVCGAVQFPGVYILQSDRRVIDAVEAAGGFLPEADMEYWNLAESLMDGEQIRIPTTEESAELEPRKESAGAAGSRTDISGGSGGNSPVNLNTASAAELMTLPGIGESKAVAIIAYREEWGPFSSIEDVMKVTGIKQGSFDRIKENITV